MDIAEIELAVIVPFYQQALGILSKAIKAVLEQRELPSHLNIQIVIVDDGSPVTAESELSGLILPPHISISLIRQANGGCSSARNRALQSLDDRTKYIAFLDSDDVWHPDYITTAIKALEKGFDLFFCDNERPGHHPSQFYSNLKLIALHIERQAANKPLYELSRDEFTSLVLQDFPAQASTTIYRREIAPKLFFNESVAVAGEDMLFFVELSRLAKRVCFRNEVMVTCGAGVNIYFSNLSWDSAGHLQQVLDRLRSHQLIKQSVTLVRCDEIWNDNLIKILRHKFVYLSLRYFIKTRGTWPPELKRQLFQDKNYLQFIIDVIYVLAGRALKFYSAP